MRAQRVQRLEGVISLRAHVHHIATGYGIRKTGEPVLQRFHSLVDLRHVRTIFGLRFGNGRRLLRGASAENTHTEDSSTSQRYRFRKSLKFHIVPI